MKLLIIIMLSVYSIVIFIFGYGFFKQKIKRKLVITDFSKKRIDTLKPSDYDKIYYGYAIKIKGYASDTIKINGQKIAGGVMDKELSFSYYGGSNVVLIFVPYKAKDGKIEIEHKLLD